MVSSVSYSVSIYTQYSNYAEQWPPMTPDGAPQPGTPAAEAGQTDLDPLAGLSETDQNILFDAIFEAALNEYFINQNGEVAKTDPELAALKKNMADNGCSFSFDHQHQEMPKFNEYAEVVEVKEKYFFPASLQNAHALLEMACIDVFKSALGMAGNNVKQARPIELPNWMEECVSEALAKSADIIDTTPPRISEAERFRPIDRDISRTMDTTHAVFGTFQLRHAMTGRGAPQQTNTPPPPPSAGAQFAAFAPKKPDIEISVEKPQNAAAAFAANSGSGTNVGGYKIKVNYKGPKIAFNTAHNACGRFGNFLAECANNGVPTDINALILWVLRESYKEGNNILLDIRERVKYFNSLKEQLRNTLKGLNEIKTKYVNDANNAVINARKEYLKTHKGEKKDRELEADFDTECAKSVHDSFDISSENLSKYFFNDSYLGSNVAKLEQKGDKISTLGELEKYIDELENKISTVGDDAQTQNINLQSAMQKQTQLIQTLSNLQKLLADTALAIIRNIS